MKAHAARSALALAVVTSLPLAAQQRPVALLTEIVGSVVEDRDARCAALSELQDRGQLDVATMVTALRAGRDVARMAAAIVRHEWAEVPAALLDGIADDAAARRALLLELALAPRPALTAWAQQEATRDNNEIGLRCLALAASGEKVTARQATMLVEAAIAAEQGEGYQTAVWLLEPEIADRLIGRLHGLLMLEGADIGRLMPFFDRLSPQGLEQLLGLVVTLPAEARVQLTRFFVGNEVPAYRKRVEAALDGRIPLESVWLMRTDGLLVTRPRIDRVLAILTDADQTPEMQSLAFESLVGAGVLEPPVVAWANESEDRPARIRRLLDVGVAVLPVRQLLAWLGDTSRVAEITAAALVRRPVLEPELQAALRELLRGTVAQGPAQMFAIALLQRGGPDAVTQIWSSLTRSPLFGQFADTLARRRAPWVHEMLLSELMREPDEESVVDRQAQLDAVRLALVSLGDRRELDALVAVAKRSEPAFVRRCTHYAGKLSPKHAVQLLRDAAALADDDLAVELIAWAAMTPDPGVERLLLVEWDKPELSERHLAAVRGLATGAVRPRFVATLRAALAAGPLGDRDEALCYELISTMPTPLRREDVELLAELVVLAPLHDPLSERRRAERWPDGRFGFPLTAAVAHRLRGGDPALVRAVFGAACSKAQGHANVAALARSRFLVLWRSLIPAPEVQLAVGEATAGFVLQLPPLAGVGEGPARLFAMWAAEAAEDWSAADVHARRAVAVLLRDPLQRQAARIFLGERDPGAGVDPACALAAAPYLYSRRRLPAAGGDLIDPGEPWLALAREFAGRDADTLKTIDDLSKD